MCVYVYVNMSFVMKEKGKKERRAGGKGSYIDFGVAGKDARAAGKLLRRVRLEDERIPW
jgi:hypothetical protein